MTDKEESLNDPVVPGGFEPAACWNGEIICNGTRRF